MTELSSEFEHFDRLFERIDRQTIDQPEKSESAISKGTRYTSSLGGKALRFVLFESDARYNPDDKPLYSPSITAYTGKPREWFHVKRRYLEPRDVGDIEKDRINKVVDQIAKIEKLLRRYEKANALRNH